MRLFRLMLFGVGFLVAHDVGSARAGDAAISVFAAASTTRAITEISDLYRAKGLGEVRPTFTNAAALAKQIEQGAPANIFISADEKWMDYVAERGLIDPASRVNLLGNRLALLAPATTTLQVKIEPGFALGQMLGDGRLAMGNPDFVPLGVYAKGALEKLGVWQDVRSRLIPTTTVLETVSFIERGEAPLGIGFASDVVGSSKVKAVALFPEDSHAPVVYPAAMVKGKETPAAAAFFKFLRTDEAAGIFSKYGFKALR